jgi:hypothetical protein
MLTNYIELMLETSLAFIEKKLPYRPLTFDFFSPKMPLFKRTGHFHRWRPLPFDSPPPKTPRRVKLSQRPWPWFSGKMSKTWVESLPKKKAKLSTFS